MNLLNQAKFVRFCKGVCKKTGRPFTRVSKEFVEAAENAVYRWTCDAIHRHPSVGKTLKQTLPFHPPNGGDSLSGNGKG